MKSSTTARMWLLIFGILGGILLACKILKFSDFEIIFFALLIWGFYGIIAAISEIQETLKETLKKT